MLGTAARSSTATDIGLLRKGGAISVRKNAVIIPTGKAIAMAITEVASVP